MTNTLFSGRRQIRGGSWLSCSSSAVRFAKEREAAGYRARWKWAKLLELPSVNQLCIPGESYPFTSADLDAPPWTSCWAVKDRLTEPWTSFLCLEGFAPAQVAWRWSRYSAMEVLRRAGEIDRDREGATVGEFGGTLQAQGPDAVGNSAPPTSRTRSTPWVRMPPHSSFSIKTSIDRRLRDEVGVVEAFHA